VAVVEQRTVIEGFEVQGVVGSGPRGTIYEAIQGSLLRTVALRILAPWLSEDREFVERFWRQQWPEHPHIVPVYEAGESEHGLFVAMQLIRGETLAEALARGGLGPAAAVGLLSQMAGALDAAHEEDIAHGWLRPEAVLIDDAGRPWLSDFGLTPGAATPAMDRDAFVKLVRSCLGKRSVPRGRWETCSAIVSLAVERAGEEAGPLRRRVRQLRTSRRGAP
jgi:serine/threonine-protein kinase